MMQITEPLVVSRELFHRFPSLVRLSYTGVVPVNRSDDRAMG